MTSFSLNFFLNQIQCSHVFLIIQFPESFNLNKNCTLLQTNHEISRAYQSSQKISSVRRPFFDPPCCEAASEPLLPKVARCIPVLLSRDTGKCAARVLKHSDRTDCSHPRVKKVECHFCMFAHIFSNISAM